MHTDATSSEVIVFFGVSEANSFNSSRLQRKISDPSGQRASCQCKAKDVPENYLEQLAKIWKLQSTEYIDGVSALYTTKGTRFDGVFTKLSVTRLIAS